MYLLMSVDQHKVYLDLWYQDTIQASRHGLLKGSDLEGLGVLAGPAGFTDLRVIHVVANALAYSLRIPVVNQAGKDWRTQVVSRLERGENDQIVKPDYGRPATTTQRLR